ncbi:proteinase-activated receptor 1-like [Rana temporaria]|uniref:proteinase-activated receptor 1-like n=1 Tax=Rana temporaria TaxID=8407 RepID=UPI001AAC7AEA|nr:proteinase-activated receptor 1-like [Rana temporaria]
MKMYLFLILGVTNALFTASGNSLEDEGLIEVEKSLNESLHNNDAKSRVKRILGMPETEIIKNDGTKLFVSFQNNPYKRVPKDVKKLLHSEWLSKFVPGVYTAVFCLSLPLNIAVLLIFLIKIKIKKPAVVYMLNLTIADLLFVCMMPFNIMYRFSGNNWRAGDVMCHIVIAGFYFNMYCSILLITSMSVDKFLAVIYPIQSLAWRTLTRAWIVCVFIWMVSIASTMPLLITQQIFYINNLEISTCHDVQDHKIVGNFYLYYFSSFTALFFFLPLIVTVFCYAATIKRLSSSEMGNTDRKKQAVVLAMIVLSIFVICFGPANLIFFVHNILVGSTSTSNLYLAYLVCTAISSISTTLNPLLYFVASPKLQSILLCKKDTEEQQPSAKA